MNRSEFESIVGDYVEREALPMAFERVLVALSGGADSVALLHVAMQLNARCVAAHCNFHLRGEESDRDERFVRDLCTRLGVTLHVKHFDVGEYMARHRGASVEMACRELRYAWFRELMLDENCRAIAVGHHRDDNVETVLMNLLRGTGVAGLKGMVPYARDVMRPLLCVTRAQILDYLDAIGETYVTDSTNAENDYTRNRIRNILLPTIEQHFPGATARIADSAAHVREFYDFYQDDLMNLATEEAISIIHDDDVLVRIPTFNICTFRHGDLLLFELLRKYGFSKRQCDDMWECVMDNRAGAHFDSGAYRMSVTTDSLELYINPDDERPAIEIDLHLHDHDTTGWPFTMSRGVLPFDPRLVIDANFMAVNEDIMKCKRVVVRPWREGDRMRPFGMKGTKLVSDLFSDAKWSERRRHNALLLECDGEVVWVMGLRTAEAFRVTPRSRDYYILSANRG